MRDGTFYKTRREAYEALAAEGLTAPQVAQALGVKLHTVHCAAVKYGIRFADGREKRPVPRKPAPKPEPQSEPTDPMAAMQALAAKENAAMRRRDRA